jgi:hypothetical protein
MMRAQLIIDFTASRWLSLLLQGCNDHFVSATALSMMDAQESGCYVQQTSSNTTKITVPGEFVLKIGPIRRRNDECS